MNSTADPPLRIFLSHTSELAEYPTTGSYVAKAKEAVESSGNVVIDMSTFPANSSSPAEYDAKRVKESDVYVGIYGPNYGTLAPGGKSFTESEYDMAVEAGIERCVFLIDENSAETGIPIIAIINKYYRKKLGFRKRVGRENILKSFGSPQHLYSLLSDALREIKKERLKLLLGQSDIVAGSFFPQAIDFGLYRKDRCRDFVGREWLLDKIRAWAKNSGASQCQLLTAGFGVGKTALLAHLVENNLTGLPLAAQHFCQGGLNMSLSPGAFVASVAAQLAESIPAYRRLMQAPEAQSLMRLLEDAHQKPLDAWNQAVLAPLGRISNPGIHHLLVIDALDVSLAHRPSAGEANNVNIVDLLAESSMPTWLRVLATSRQINEVIYPLTQNRFSHQLLKRDDPRHLADLQEYAEARCKTDTLQDILLAANLSASDVVDELCDKNQSDGKFLYVEYMLNAIEKKLLPLKNLADLKRLPPEMSGFYRLAFKRCFNDDADSYQSTRAILGVMCEQREPLGLNELSAILGFTKKQIRTDLQKLTTFIRCERKEVKRDGKPATDIFYSFDHVSLPWWLYKELDAKDTPLSSPYDIDLDDAKACIHAWALDEVSKNRAHLWPYLARHLGSHLTPEDWQQHRNSLLCNINWIDARSEHASINDLLRDFNADRINKAVLPVQVMERVLGQSEQILRAFPQQMPSQILARIEHESEEETINNICNEAERMCKERRQAIPLFPSLGNQQLLRRRSTEGSVQCLLYSQDDRSVFWGCHDGRIGRWNLMNGDIKYCIDKTGHQNVVSTLAPVSDQFIASASWDGKIIIWKRDDLTKHYEWEGHDLEINALLSFRHAHQTYLISASDDQRICVWDTRVLLARRGKRGNPLRKSIDRAHESWVTYLAYLGDTAFASASKDGSVRIWDAEDYKMMKTFELGAEVISLAPSLATGCLYVVTDPGEARPNNVYRIDLATEEVKEDSSFPNTIHTLLSPNETDLLYHFSDTEDRVVSCKPWDSDISQTKRLGIHDGPINCITLSTDNSFLVSASIDSNSKERPISVISIWSPFKGSESFPTSFAETHQGRITLIKKIGNNCVYSFATDGSGCIWSISEPPDLRKRFCYKVGNNTSKERDIFFLTKSHLAIREGERLSLFEIPTSLSAQTEYKAIPFDLDNRARILQSDPSVVTQSRKYGPILGCKDGSLLYSIDKNNSAVKISQAAIGEVTFMEEIDDDRILCWSSASSKDHSFWICDLQEKRGDTWTSGDNSEKAIESKIYTIPLTAIYGERFINNNIILFPLRIWENSIAVAHSDGMASIWSLADDSQELILQHRLEGHTSRVIALEFLPNDSYITISADKTVRLWKTVGDKLEDHIIFASDFKPLCIHYIEATGKNSEPMILVGDDMGIIHWLRLSQGHS